MTHLKSRKKILYLITKSYFGGAQRYVLDLALAVKNKGYDVVVGCGPKGELISRLEDAGIPVRILENSQRDLSFVAEIKTLRELYRLIKTEKPDIVHLNSSKMGLLGVLVARALRTPQIIFTAHGWPFLEHRSLLWRTMAYLGSYLTALLAHKVIVVSYHDLQNTRMPGIKSKIVCIHNALEPYTLLGRDEAREKLFTADFISNHSHHLWLVTHGELNRNKNHTTAIDAVAEFNSTHGTKILYVIIGSGDTKEALLEQAELKGLLDYIIFLDPVKDIRSYLLAFDIYLMPSLKEGLPYALLEAGYAGLPVIASRVGGIPEVINHNEHGLLVEPDNHLNLVSALLYLINNPDQRSLQAEHLQIKIKRDFSLEKMLEKTTALY